MNKLQRLKNEIQLLPAKQQRADLVGTLQKYNSQMTNAVGMLNDTHKTTDFVKIVSETMDLGLVADKTSVSAKTAQRLRKSLSENIQNIRNADDKVFTIESNAKVALVSLRDKWRTMLQSRIENYEKIVKAAKNANLNGSIALTETLEQLKGRAQDLPKSEESAQKTANLLADVADSIHTLGLEGKVGEFLIAAAAGNANAQLLTDVEVCDFVEKHKLWSALSVRLE